MYFVFLERPDESRCFNVNYTCTYSNYYSTVCSVLAADGGLECKCAHSSFTQPTAAGAPVGNVECEGKAPNRFQRLANYQNHARAIKSPL